MPLNLSIPVYFADGGPNVALAKPWYKTLLRAHAEEMRSTFGDLEPVPATGHDTSWIAILPTPSVLVLPALCGGWVDKGAWWAFCGHLQDYRGAGGVVVCLDKAFNLPADGQKAAGRGWEGFRTDASLPSLKGRLAFSCIDRDSVAVNARGLRVWSEWKRDEERIDSRGNPVAWVESAERRVPVGWSWSREGWEEPGLMLFLSCWGRTRSEAIDGKDWYQAPSSREVAEAVFVAFRRTNLAVVQRHVGEVIVRRQARSRRLERLAGETVRLPNRVGREKDYHRLLVNDSELCVDIVGWRALVGEDAEGTSRRFSKTFREAAVVNEPGHAKTQGGKGRLDILLLADASAEEQGGAYVADRERQPVAWIELEAGPIHLHQIEAFLGGQGRQLRAGDFVCAVDRSHDDAPEVKRARALTEACGAAFLHAQVPQVFARLEEAYAPCMHRLSRKRYTLEVIRGLLG